MNIFKIKVKSYLSIVLVTIVTSILVLQGCHSSKNKTEVTSMYANTSNWAYLAYDKDLSSTLTPKNISEEIQNLLAITNKKADLFIVAPTVDIGEKDNMFMSLDDENTKRNFIAAINMEIGIYDDSTIIYSPFYRQITLKTYGINSSVDVETTNNALNTAYLDVRKAFLYYMNNYNHNRPIVLAGFSQGSDMIIRLLKEFFNKPEYQNKLVAAYAIGWRITENELKQYPHLKIAQNETDVGTIILFNTEDGTIEESLMIPRGVKSFCINPLNWRTDSTLADKTTNQGAVFINSTNSVEMPNLTGAYINEERGSLIATDVNKQDFPGIIFADGVYHLYDYQFFYKNLQENVAKRVNEYLENNNQ